MNKSRVSIRDHMFLFPNYGWPHRSAHSLNEDLLRSQNHKFHGPGYQRIIHKLTVGIF
jgi:hypothetical protein